MHLKELIETLKKRRELLGVTQEHLAELSGVGLRTLKALESGKSNHPAYLSSLSSLKNLLRQTRAIY